MATRGAWHASREVTDATIAAGLKLCHERWPASVEDHARRVTRDANRKILHNGTLRDDHWQRQLEALRRDLLL
eukprot:4850509-Lingulodinium_polyedra.AAC.1